MRSATAGVKLVSGGQRQRSREAWFGLAASGCPHSLLKTSAGGSACLPSTLRAQEVSAGAQGLAWQTLLSG